LTATERNALLNFLAAPDGQRLFEINCSGCHGYGVTYTGTESSLRDLISKGGQHMSMPAWQGTLSETQIDSLAAYVANPVAYPAGADLFGQYCSACHGDRVPSTPDINTARKVIRGGGPHVTMPVWGDILTPEQLDALVQYTLQSGQAKGTEEGARLFAENCSVCHGAFGEGGPNPTRTGDMIPPISSAEFLGTRDDTTLTNIIAQGQPDLGMNPFGSSYGGSLSDDEIDALVAYIRGWQANPPAVAPLPEPTQTPAPAPTTALQIYQGVCAQCHGANGEGGSAPALNTAEFQSKYSDEALSALISDGIPSTPMIGVGGVFSQAQIKDLVGLIRSLKPGATLGGTSTYSSQVAPILQAECKACHSSSMKLGGWDISTYESVMTSGDHGPVVIAGDTENSLLAQMIQGVGGKTMPPQGPISQQEVQVILDWIAAGAAQ
jgi:mono/diheme cytochrome c family protein